MNKPTRSITKGQLLELLAPYDDDTVIELSVPASAIAATERIGNEGDEVIYCMSIPGDHSGDDSKGATSIALLVDAIVLEGGSHTPIH